MAKRKALNGQTKAEKPIQNGKSKVNEKEEKPKAQEFDSDEEADLRNTIGNVPIQWYEDYDHIGYDLRGDQIEKPEGARKKGEIDEFLDKVDDPNYWRRVFDQQTGGDIELTDEQVEKLKNIAANRYSDPTYNPYEPFHDIFSYKKEIHPISNRPEDKRSFIPSADERRIVGRLLHSMKMGWLKPKEPKKPEEAYDLWASEDSEPKSKNELARLRTHCPAPKMSLPKHAESYNPPGEYLLTEDELKKWEEMEPETRKMDFVPHKYDALRKVPFYERFYRERFERCMDLYLAPRQIKMKLNVEMKTLLPDLPNPQDLQPFPTTLGFYMRGHKGQVRSLSVEPECGELLVSGGEDCTVRVWYIPTGRCLKTFKMSSPVTSVAYSPNAEHTLVLVGCESQTVTLMNIECGDKLRVSKTREFLENIDLNQEREAGDESPKWSRNKQGNIEITLPDNVRQVTWHKRGDFFATVGFSSSAKTIYVHRISTSKSQKPFNKSKGSVQQVLFHPTKPQFFIATKQHIRLYDLSKCALLKKIFTGTKWLSSIHLDASGNNIFVGGLDRVFSWIDLELSNKPWKTLRSHSSAVRALTYHKKLPLLATVSDDATAIVYHARCPQDFTQENELVPVKRLFGHKHQQEELPNRQGEVGYVKHCFPSDSAVAFDRWCRWTNWTFHLLIVVPSQSLIVT
ncbi:Ribosome biogenesis protein BOP1-like protein [Aphelenchoides bicaudatus]|nr:Ribosome biogenesis protein BOP1-like protein [Aphelenchoides bicaudatus]